MNHIKEGIDALRAQIDDVLSSFWSDLVVAEQWLDEVGPELFYEDFARGVEHRQMVGYEVKIRERLLYLTAEQRRQYDDYCARLEVLSKRPRRRPNLTSPATYMASPPRVRPSF